MVRELLGKKVVVKTLDGKFVKGVVIRLEPTVAGMRVVVESGSLLLKVREDQIVGKP